MHDTGCLGLAHWDDPEGWYREGGGRGVQDGENLYRRAGMTDEVVDNALPYSGKFPKELYK